MHGIMFARVPGLWQYRQLRLAANRADLWPAIQGVSFAAPAAAHPQGLPHALFRSEDDLVAFRGNWLARETIPKDARNFISRIGALLSHHSGRTLVDRINDPAMQGVPPVPTFAVCFVPRRSRDSSIEMFHRCLTENVAQSWSEHPGVIRLRVEPLPSYEHAAMTSPGTEHQWPTDETYLGWIELAVRGENVLGSLMARVIVDEFSARVAAVHAFPIREVYTIVSAGRPTAVGLRGYPAVQTIIAAGAGEQRSKAVPSLIYGRPD